MCSPEPLQRLDPFRSRLPGVDEHPHLRLPVAPRLFDLVDGCSQAVGLLLLRFPHDARVGSDALGAQLGHEVALLALPDGARDSARRLEEIPETLRLAGNERSQTLLEVDPVGRRAGLLALAGVEPRKGFPDLHLELDVAPCDLLDGPEELPLQPCEGRRRRRRG